jgi:oligoendopeptidase F
MAVNADLPDFRALMWKRLKRFDYTHDDCLHFADSVAATVVPVVRELNRARAKQLGLERLRPWDLSVDPLNRPPLRPFAESDIDGFVASTHAIFQRLSPALADDFDSLRRNENLDLASRKGKQPGGYATELDELRQPFIFMNAAGLHNDVEILLHEAGHAFHSLATRDEPLLFVRSAPIEFCEVASMTMELFGGEHLDIFYNAEDHARAKRKHFEGSVLASLTWIAMIDSFQHWLYTHPGHTRDARTQEWLRLVDRFGPDVDITGVEEPRSKQWQRQLHLFQCPFYYIEYGIAQLGALQLWMKSKENPHQALSNYRAALALGGTRPLPELFAAAGIRFDFSEKTLMPLVNAVREELASLPE